MTACALCGRPCYLGAAHPCCVRQAATQGAGEPCEACGASADAARRRGERPGRDRRAR